MTPESERQWAEILALAETVFRQAASGGVPDRDAAGALAERVLAFDRGSLPVVDLEEVDGE